MGLTTTVEDASKGLRQVEYIKLIKSTIDKPEVLRVASLLGTSRDTAFAKIVRFWMWCDDNVAPLDDSEHGIARGVTTALLDEILGTPGLSAALLEVDWLRVRSGSLVIPHFDRHLSQGAKARALASSRQSNHRERKKRDKSNAQCNGQALRDALPEKRREEKKEKRREEVDTTGPPFELLDGCMSDKWPIPFPDGFDTPEFRAAWARWMGHLADRNRLPSHATLQANVAWLLKTGVDASIEAIDLAIQKGWTSLWERKPEGVNEKPALDISKIKF